MKTYFILSVVVLCVIAQAGAAPVDLTSEQLAGIISRAQDKLCTLSSAAQKAGNEIIAAVQANPGNPADTKQAVKSILSGLSESVKKELSSLLPEGAIIGAAPADLSSELLAGIISRAQDKLCTLSPAAQTAGNEIIAAVQANPGNPEDTKKAVESILSGLSDSVKKELSSLLPEGEKSFIGLY